MFGYVYARGLILNNVFGITYENTSMDSGFMRFIWITILFIYTVKTSVLFPHTYCVCKSMSSLFTRIFMCCFTTLQNVRCLSTKYK